MESALALVRENAFYIALIGLIVTGLVVLRTKPTDLASLEELDARLTSGKPTLIEFFSNT